MLNFLTIILSFVFLSFSPNASDFEKAKDTIQIRKTAMQGIWLRIKRLSPYVELNEQVDYGKDIAEQDAKEIEILLKKTKNMWPQTSNLSPKGYTNATPAIWALPGYFEKLYNQAENSATKLRESIEKDMNNRNSTSKVRINEKSSNKTRKKREELSVSASKSIKKEKVEIVVNFD